MSAGADRILIVDRDEAFRRALADELRALWPARAIHDAGPVGMPWTAVAPDVALCGLNDAGDHGWLGRLREDRPELPVIALLGAGQDGGGQDGGGQDGGGWPARVHRLPKPVRLADLVAMIERVGGQRAGAGRAGGRLQPIGDFQLDAGAKLLQRGDWRVRLTEKEAALLDYLAGAERAVSRDELLARVWGYSATADTHALETLVYRLRRKIESEPAGTVLLVTEGGGYRLLR